MGWAYPPNSILGTIFLVPIEEHLFFILQPILLVLLHSICSHARLLPFDVPAGPASLSTRSRQNDDLVEERKGRRRQDAVTDTIQTLPRRPLAAMFWVFAFVLGAVLVNEAHDWFPDVQPRLELGKRAFYLGWILVWISPVIGWLTWLGSSMGRDGWRAWAVGSAWLCFVDT